MHVCVCIYVCMYVYACMYVCMYACMYVGMHVSQMSGVKQISKFERLIGTWMKWSHAYFLFQLCNFHTSHSPPSGTTKHAGQNLHIPPAMLLKTYGQLAPSEKTSKQMQIVCACRHTTAIVQLAPRWQHISAPDKQTAPHECGEQKGHTAKLKKLLWTARAVGGNIKTDAHGRRVHATTWLQLAAMTAPTFSR